MRAFKVFVFGLLYGWFIKIAFDRIYRENEMEDLRNENNSLRNYVHTLKMQLEQKSQETPSMQFSAPTEQQEAPVPVQETAQKDNLKVIKGIGPAIEKKLNNAGIYTFAALAALTKKDLENILGNQVKRLQDENDLLAQARKLARQK